jgi:transcriptional regulator with XRE-family HTH domain
MPIQVFTDLDHRAVGERLRAVREHLGLTQEQCAWRANLRLEHYQKIEAGMTPFWSANALYKLCQVLGASADELLGLHPLGA